MTITDKLRDSKAFYVAAGAGDLAVEKLREVPDRLNKLQEKTDPKDIGGAAVAYVTHVGTRAVEVYDGLAERGKRIVSRVDRQKATQELEESAKATVRRARTAAGSAKSTVRSAAKATGDASKKVGT
ncbi:hypothetical protein GCM10027176_23930 [Actinoallomurus bryophytorum]|uniref:Uncharacterized protein n=1 Tax=Actinoallomurus bryophytorum TaxID=1490222 RepID=A0A543CH21_9ACTN|nr:hypothetical protein [Actinoallomurus bryophytorum]TQL96310.1 hypothetical protein FB559_1836 [Actinoallomurus bryophytorum]